MTDPTPEELAAARRLLKSYGGKKGAASRRESGRLGGRPRIPIDEIPCTCTPVDGVHTWKCRRRQTEYQRQRRFNQTQIL